MTGPPDQERRRRFVRRLEDQVAADERRARRRPEPIDPGVVAEAAALRARQNARLARAGLVLAGDAVACAKCGEVVLLAQTRSSRRPTALGIAPASIAAAHRRTCSRAGARVGRSDGRL